MQRQERKQKGITLVALVITIIVLIILAGVSIAMLVGENGIITQAQRAKEETEQAKKKEETDLDSMDEYINGIIKGKDSYVDNVLITSPKLSNGMIPVKYVEGTGWVKTDSKDNQWYNYENKEWANVVLEDSSFTIKGNNEVLDETQPYSMLVWIPRYAYQITSQYHTGGETAGNINIVFISTENKGKDGKIYNTTYPTVAVDGRMEDYVVHPAFDYGETQLEGIWVGKYESSNRTCTIEATTGEKEYTGEEVITIRAGVTSWRNISEGNAFSTCLNMNKEGNPYGLSSNDNEVDPHLMKNGEWGAVAYLTQSRYGKNNKIWNNSNNSYITGMAGSSVDAADEDSTNAYNTTLGVEASTTGNITGIYDMSGGAGESIAAYVDNGSSSLTRYGGDLVAEATDSRYRNVYVSTVNDGTDAQEEDYLLATPMNGHYGDAIYETSEKGSDYNAWNGNSSGFPKEVWPIFGRGGNYSKTFESGIFHFGISSGIANTGISFRISISVL